MRGAFLLLLLWSMPTTPAFAAQAGSINDAVAEAEVRTVIERFRTAILRGDGAAMRALFLPQPQTWISVAGEDLLMWRRAKEPAAPRLYPSTYAAFAEGLEKTPGREEEVFSNIDVRTDGAVATVTFDFVYRIDGAPQNRGLEAWHLVKAEDGWKIASLVYSSHDPP